MVCGAWYCMRCSRPGMYVCQPVVLCAALRAYIRMQEATNAMLCVNLLGCDTLCKR